MVGPTEEATMKDIRCLVLGHSWKLRRAPAGEGHYLRCQRCAAERDTGGRDPGIGGIPSIG